jgi:hypothetical protein
MMDTLIAPLSHRFAQSLESIRRDHPYAEEIARMDLSAEVFELLRETEDLNGSSLRQYAVSLQNSRLELIFHALTYEIPSGLKDKLLVILSSRIKKRFFHYNWIMLQEHYTNRYLIESFSLLLKYMQQKYPIEYQRSLGGRIPMIERDLIHQALEILTSEGCTLNAFFQKFSVLRESSFAKDLLYEYYLRCTGEGFHHNPEFFLVMLRQSENRLYLQINHYLDVLNVLDYIVPINHLLIERFGLPGENIFWDNIEEEFQEKFIEWNKIKDLGKYWGITNEKFVFWRDYHHYITKIDFYPDQGLMFLYLPHYVVVDIKKDKSKSYLYKQSAFHYIYKTYQEAGGFQEKKKWPIEADAAIHIKDVILEGMDSNIFILTYERVGKLYIEDYLDQNL